MDVVNLRIRYRPLRVGFCINQDDLEAFQVAAKLASTMWGGKFNPIIPITTDLKLSHALVAAYRVDGLYPVTESASITAFIDGYSNLRWPSFQRQLFTQRTNGVDATMLDIIHPVRHLATSPARTPERRFEPLLMNWADDDPLRHVLAATFGTYPSKEQVGKDYATLFKRLAHTEITLGQTEVVPVDGLEMLTPMTLTSLELSPRRVGWGHEEPGFYLGSASDFDDLVNYWNLRAADIDLLFYDPMYSERLQAVTDLQKQRLQDRPKRDPEWPFNSIVWTKTREPHPDITPFGEGFAIAVAEIDTWDANNMWQPPSMVFEEHPVLGTVSHEFNRPSVTFQLPNKPFFSHHALHEQHVVVSVTPLVEDNGLILNPPYMPELNQFFGREIYYDASKARSEPDGLGIITKVTRSDLTLRGLDGHQLIEQIFTSRGASASASDAGRIGRRLIQQLGGLQGCRVFKIPGVRRLIQEHSPLASFTRSNAIQTIRGQDVATNTASFDAHSDLHIQFRSGNKLKPEDAFSYLLDKRMFRAGLSFKCPHCDLEFWLHLDSVKTDCVCEYCDTTFNVMPMLKDRDWRFRRTGLFGREDNQAGGIPVAVVLQQLHTVLHEKIVAWTTGVNIEVNTPTPWRCESDFVLIARDPQEGPQIVLSEVKSAGGEISEADVANLARLADMFEASSITPYIVFAKLGQFTTEEIQRCRLAQPHRRRPRVILLSDRELEPYFVYERTVHEFEINQHAINLEDLAQATTSIYFTPRPKQRAEQADATPLKGS